MIGGSVTASRVRQEAHQALELEFYVPEAVWDRPATQAFLTQVYSLVEGATLLGGARGVWRGQVESTNLVRIVVRTRDVDVDGLLAVIKSTAAELLLAWAGAAGEQASFMYTVRELVLHEATLERADGRLPHPGEPEAA